jgi:protein gp37
MAKRLRAMALADIKAGKDPGRKRHYIDAVDDNGRWTGKLVPVPEALTDPLGWRKPCRVFVNSMSDLFHEDVPDEFIAAAFGTMAAAERHTFQILTKRPARMRDWFAWIGSMTEKQQVELASKTGCFYRPWPLTNVWLGVSVERQQEADERIPLLLATPAAVRFLSCEPLLGPVRIPSLYRCGRCNPLISPGHKVLAPSDESGSNHGAAIHWIIDGCESGPKRREYRLEWSRSIQEQCAAAGVAYFRKQMIINGRVSHDPAEWPEDLRVREFPEAAHA